MFNFAKGNTDEEQETSVADTMETVTSLSDTSSAPDEHDVRRDIVDGPVVKQTGIINFGLSDERTSRQRPMLDLVDRLRSLGVEFDIDLPQIVAVGMQNVGKSSLIEGISGIKLPRASGTCTRCPTELRMKRNTGRWKCDISLQIVYDEEGTPLGQPQKVEFGAQIINPYEVEDRVKKAQRAILTPSVPPRDFLRGAVSEAPDLTFSKNYISILVEGPNIADLSFVDLPGLIASSRQGNSSDISTIEDLVGSYIQKRSTLILLTVTCETDFYTHGAYQLVKRYDPDGLRTIGVLTKPDRIPAGEEEQWTRLIKNEEEELDLGWFCVKQPDAIQLQKGLTWEEAREAEDKWFRDSSNWNQLSAKDFMQLGTMNLVKRLGETLANLITQRLPELREELDDLLQQTEEDMKYLPVPPSEDALAEMMHLISSFCAEVARHSEGIPGNEGLLQSINEKQAEFRRSVLSLAPEFRPYKRSDSAADLPQLPPCEFLDGEDEDRLTSESRLVMYVDEVMELLRRSRTRELPDYYPYEVPKHVIEESTKNWKAMVFKYFDGVWNVVQEHYKTLVEETFQHFESGGLLYLVQTLVRDLIQQHRVETQERLQWILDALGRPFTLNNRYLSEYKGKFLAYYKTYRFNVLNRSPMTYIQTFNSGRSVNYVSEVLSTLGKMGIQDVKALDLAKLLPEDDYAPAVNLMAVVSAYFQVASKRFIDVIPAAVDHDFVLGLSSSLQTALYTGIIKGDARNRCKTFLQEAPSVAARRAKLQKKYQRLEAAKVEMLSLRWGDM